MSIVESDLGQNQSSQVKPHIIQDIYLFDSDNSGNYKKSDIDLEEKPELTKFLIDLCKRTYSSESSRSYKFNESSVTYGLTVSFAKEVTDKSSFAQTIANKLSESEKQSSFKPKDGTFIIATIKSTDRHCLILAKLDFENFFSKDTYLLQSGLPEDKGILKSCLINVDGSGALETTIYLMDKNGKIADFWWNKFLNSTPSNKDEENTLKAYQTLKTVLKSNLRKSKPDMFQLVECLNSYFSTNDNFDFEDFVNNTIKKYKPDNPEVDVNKLAVKLSEAKDKAKFDGQFDIKIDVIKTKLKSKITLDGGITLHTEGEVSELIKRTKIGNDSYLLIKTEKGLDTFSDFGRELK